MKEEENRFFCGVGIAGFEDPARASVGMPLELEGLFSPFILAGIYAAGSESNSTASRYPK